MTITLLERQCPSCNEAFTPKAKHGKFCSEKCRHRHNDKAQQERKLCRVCSSAFTAPLNSVFCSSLCARSSKGRKIERQRTHTKRGIAFKTREQIADEVLAKKQERKRKYMDYLAKIKASKLNPEQRVERRRLYQRMRYALNPKAEVDRSRNFKNRKRGLCGLPPIVPREPLTEQERFSKKKSMDTMRKAERRARLKGAVTTAKPSQLRALKEAAVECTYCKQEFTEHVTKTIDHVIPLAAGGEHSMCNLVVCCSLCNSRKRDLPVHVFINRYITAHAAI